jgi:hypothetical protein
LERYFLFADIIVRKPHDDGPVFICGMLKFLLEVVDDLWVAHILASYPSKIIQVD